MPKATAVIEAGTQVTLRSMPHRRGWVMRPPTKHAGPVPEYDDAVSVRVRWRDEGGNVSVERYEDLEPTKW